MNKITEDDFPVIKENILIPRSNIPHIIKYMGSKRNLLDDVISALNELYDGEVICDLFAGTSVLSGALGNIATMHANDIQQYSSVLAKTYLGDYNWSDLDGILDDIVDAATRKVDHVHKLYPNFNFVYHQKLSLEEFNALEHQQQDLISFDFKGVKNYLFTQSYSGTYWTYEQCLWIDALRAVAEKYSGTPVYYPIISSLMFAMAYNAQSTGHYAQYRDANDIKSMKDISIYRVKEILPYFKRKFTELEQSTSENKLEHTITSLDYRECLDQISSKSLVYADPPYAFVHYSRFYHALETLVKYDYPKLLYKGRYRNDRHQSPFCKRTEVSNAFQEMFSRIKMKKAKLVLSYSNTGMISLDSILSIAQEYLGCQYEITTKSIDYTHSTMGRSQDKSRQVKEYLIIAKPL